MSEECFRLYKLFKNSPKVSLSKEEIADFYEESLEVIQTWIQEDLENGMIFTNENLSSFYLTLVGFDKFQELKQL